jgi:hypothetical protein
MTPTITSKKPCPLRIVGTMRNETEELEWRPLESAPIELRQHMLHRVGASTCGFTFLLRLRMPSIPRLA